jgi:hypothetical protein
MAQMQDREQQRRKKTNLHTAMLNAPGTTSVGSMIFYVVKRET